MRKKSLELQYLETLSERTKLTKVECKELMACQSGFQGEVTFDKVTWPLFKPDFVIDDLNLSYGDSRVQIDKLLQVGERLYLINVKNYSGNYQFKSGSWYHNNVILAHSIFTQIDRAHDILAKILSDSHINLQIVKVIVFMNANTKLDVQDPTDILTMSFGSFFDWMQRNIKEAEFLPMPNERPWQQTLQKFLVLPYKNKADFSMVRGRKLKVGIRCPNCGKFEWQVLRFSLRCKNRKCRFGESKEQAYVRTICEYGTLFFTQDLRFRNVRNFFGDVVNESYLRYILGKHFKPGGKKARQYCYVNKGMRFEYWFEHKQQYFLELQKRLKWQKSGERYNS